MSHFLTHARFLLAATLAVVVAAPNFAQAAPCCGGSLAFPSLILTDDRAQVGMRLSHGSVIGDVLGDGVSVFRARGHTEDTWMGRVDGAYRLTDRFQMGASVPWVWRSVSKSGGSINSADQGLGDVMVNLGYEALPEWNYSRLMPQGFVFFQWTAPTGRSIRNAQNTLRLDATGLGMHGLTTGGLFIKRFSGWDASFNTDVTAYVPVEGESTSSAHLGLRMGGGAGFSFGRDVYRLGARIQGAFTTTKGQGQGASRVWDTGLEFGALVSDELSLQLSYADQTLISFFGPPLNATLSRVVALSLQVRSPL